MPPEDVGLAIAVEVPHATTVQSVGAPPGTRADDSRPVQQPLVKGP